MFNSYSSSGLLIANVGKVTNHTEDIYYHMHFQIYIYIYIYACYCHRNFFFI